MEQGTRKEHKWRDQPWEDEGGGWQVCRTGGWVQALQPHFLCETEANAYSQGYNGQVVGGK